MKDRAAKAGGRLAGIIIAVSVVLLAAVMPAAVSKVIPAYENTCLGWRPLVVRTNSMEGAIRKNALIIVYAARWDTLKVGDVITFQRADGQLDTHRVIARDGAHITTKGDNAAAPDAGWVTPDNYKYKVILIWNWMAWLSDHRGAAYLICLPPLLVVLAAAAVLIVRRVRKKRKLRAESIEQTDDTVPDDADMAGGDGSLAWMDEIISLLEDLPVRPQSAAAVRKEVPNGQNTVQANAFAAADDALDWDDWALLQLRRCAASPGDALSAIG